MFTLGQICDVRKILFCNYFLLMRALNFEVNLVFLSRDYFYLLLIHDDYYDTLFTRQESLSLIKFPPSVWHSED